MSSKDPCDVFSCWQHVSWLWRRLAHALEMSVAHDALQCLCSSLADGAAGARLASQRKRGLSALAGPPPKRPRKQVCFFGPCQTCGVLVIPSDPRSKCLKRGRSRNCFCTALRTHETSQAEQEDMKNVGAGNFCAMTHCAKTCGDIIKKTS